MTKHWLGSMGRLGLKGMAASGSLPGWSFGADLWKDFLRDTGNYPDPTDTHAQTIYAPNAAGVYAPFAADVLTRTDLGLQTVPTRVQMFNADPSDATLNPGNQLGQTITPNATIDAFGGNDGDRVDLVAGGSYCYWRVNTGAAAVARAAYLILRADAPVTLRLRLADSLGADTSVVSINVTTSWQRFEIADLSHTAATYTEIGIDTRSAVAGGDNLAKTFYVCHRQMEAAPFCTTPIRVASATVNGNQQVISGLGTQLATGVAGLVQVNVMQPAADFVRLLEFNDSTGPNSFLLSSSGGNLRLEMIAAGVSQASVLLAPWAQGVQTIAFIGTTNYVMGRVVGQSAPSPDTTATYPLLDRVSPSGSGRTAANNTYSYTSKIALDFLAPGDDPATKFAGWDAKAELAAAA